MNQALLAPNLDELIARARRFASNGRSEATKRAYRADWSDFSTWCASHGLSALPAVPATIALYLTDQAPERANSTLRRRLAAISVAHQSANLVSPCGHATVKTVLVGIFRSRMAPQTQKRALMLKHLKNILACIPNDRRGLRDRALILCCFAGAFRRSEIVGVRIEDLTFEFEGMLLNICRSKTDQESHGRLVPITFGKNQETCPVETLKAWINHSGLTNGPVFRAIDRHDRMRSTAITPQAVNAILKSRLENAGYDSKAFGAHSLRAGYMTSASAAGASEQSIMALSGHTSLNVARRYTRRGTIWQSHPSSALDL